jgi:RND family efflux transporter MFP subunit
MDTTSLECGSAKEADLGSRQKQKGKRSRPIKLMVGLVLVGFTLVSALGIMARMNSATVLQQRTNRAAELTVAVVTPDVKSAAAWVDLPGQTQAYVQAPIYAQTTGYLKSWRFDIGAKVNAGDILAEIDTPQVDQQLSQAKANLRQTQAALDLSRVTFLRDQDLLQRKVISQQDFDTASSDFRSKEANVNADAAAVSALQALEDFKLVRAPFTGIVTARNTDIGQMVTSGSGTPLFIVAQVSTLRIYINVPESMASSTREGQPATITFSEFPGQKFPGQVVRTARAIDPNSRTLLTEVDLPNSAEQLFPGAYAQVHLGTNASRSSLLPANALLFRAEGPAVGVVGADNRVQIKRISIGRDLGTELEIVDGISPTDRVIVNPSDSLANGAAVQVAANR